MTPLSRKSSLDEIRARFDADVDRFSQLETGQQATLDAPLVLDRVAHTASTHLRSGDRLLDLGCGAGNFTLRVMQECGTMDCTLVDLSTPMLERARKRVADAGATAIHTLASDLRDLELPENSFDAILAGAVLHHLREDDDWSHVFRQLHRWLRPGGRLYVADLVEFDDPRVQAKMWQNYGDYLTTLGGEDYRDRVFAYIDQEDSPRSLPYQIRLLEQCGFSHWDILHRNSVFACYLGEK
ncbi:tRNA (cmo5U34)-methyltransferase [Haloferula luteola]|uniref:tRNA (Cmo5U34)-methyltransferase n=1 Tax=Haloferula luteola TaxID=595692 RepID=A0A840VCQ3_9BACT|nr:class I SAM-dependent methyltransferase [Haloferula luteola]MBB5351589.1 tRNA (cmo5U34)-methyltransferase [Haloferula luteola]